MNEAMQKARAEIARLPGITEDELIKLGDCQICGKPLLDPEIATPLFYRVTVESCGFDASTIERRVGLTLQMGGHDALARMFSPDRYLARVLSGPHKVVVHSECATRVGHLALLIPDEPGTPEETVTEV